MLPSSRLGLTLFLCLLVAAIGAACGSGSESSAFGSGRSAASLDGDGDDGAGSDDSGKLFGDDGSTPAGTLVISPANKTITVTYGQQTPTVKYSATIGSQAVPASFSIDLGQIAGMGSSTGVLAPTGKFGGVANVFASFGG